ncbi:nicotinate-nucleotide--dimethylbenzimidazole phosphoribosyltransferase [Roseovarius sp. SCSIO 43702]|uniref:nicotinate-nucleotide--dimethylbenzimidazole phosphoribosyltransferase n=1 Tax=Roseovarius sp. SCSIO 43702 TaxID=2823043 RepID=UPI001C739AEA|nr:nicotinate-nucleotide--dimethylbenzimidazole phosphoribosyltransferase [Roseovarius sp. SCSIO 43702]QYX58238.1 nicotinate-nucleotide--dimethylbenzimidazole phosphoribosyltransferase [Roseovarius sp. SCSIO 43702]
MPPTIETVDDIRACLGALPAPDGAARRRAGERNAQLTKPPGSLGRLEELAVWYAGWRGEARPLVERPQVIVFAGNHGVTQQGVSAFPADVTAQMVANFEAGGAAINQLSQAAGARLDVVALDLDQPTRDFTQAAAMDVDKFVKYMRVGWESIDNKCDLLVAGEMGIGNTTSAAAMACALFGGTAQDWTGRGTGVEDSALDHKIAVVERAVARHAQAGGRGLDVLRCLGGHELAALAGAILRARMERIPVILDGFICTAAAACLAQENKAALDHCVAGHLSAEGAHGALLEKLGKAPILDLHMRLGEGSGATLAIAILKAAVACHSGMASFSEAGISGSERSG